MNTPKPKCAICNKGRSRGELIKYPTILQSMGYLATLAHTKCILRIQQQALYFKGRLTNGR